MVVARNKSMRKLGPLRGRRVVYQYNLKNKKEQVQPLLGLRWCCGWQLLEAVVGLSLPGGPFQQRT